MHLTQENETVSNKQGSIHNFLLGKSSTMGCQSQLRDGSIKACKKRATKAKHRRKSLTQMGVDGKRAFLPEKDCAVCKAKHLIKNGVTVAVPHRSHDPRCTHNRKTRGLSARTVEVEKIAQNNIFQNNIPPVMIPASEALKNASDLRLHFGGCHHAAQLPTMAKAKSTPLPPPTAPSKKIAATTLINNSTLPDAAAIQTEVVKRYQSRQSEYSWATRPGYKPPVAIALAIDYILGLFKHRRPTRSQGTTSTALAQKAHQTFRAFFPFGRCDYEFPVVNPVEEEVHPLYHAIQGQSFFFLDWELHYPGLAIHCFECKTRHNVTSELSRGRNNFGKSKSLFPLWRPHTGTPSWCVTVTYQCNACKSNFSSNDGRILQVLPAWLRQQYPVAPRYAVGAFHLDQEYSQILESMMVSTSSATQFSKLLFKKFNCAYVDKVESYLSMQPAIPYIDTQGFHGLTWPPSPDTVRDLYLEAERSCLTPYGYSNESRFNRELQAVNVASTDVIAIDWTFQTLKNFQLPGAEALFTANKGETKEIVTLLIVDSTKASQVAHGLVMARQKRENFCPNAIYTDTCPHNITFWRLLFGATVVLRLGLFHLIQRIYRTLDTRSNFFWKVLVELKAALYSYYEEDMAKLLDSLKNGTFDSSGKKYTSSEIVQLQHSKRWNQRFGAYLRKRIHSAPVISQKIDCWIERNSKLRDSNGRSVFSRETEQVAKEQLKKVEYICDLEQNHDRAYQEIRPGPRSQHGLSKWKSHHPESHLENWHEYVAHLANSGMRPDLSSCLTMRGTCEWNVKCGWVSKVQDNTAQGDG